MKGYGKTEVDLKKSGILKQRQKDMFCLRLKVPISGLKGEALVKLAEVSKRYGKGYVHITTRQGIELPWISYKDFANVHKELAGVGILPGSCGPRVRCITTCQGTKICPYAVVDSESIGMELDRRFFAMELPTKFKLSVSGCPNSCSKPQENDFGLMGVVEPEHRKDTCNSCGLCIEVCKKDAIVIKEEGLIFDKTRCNWCGECINVCPSDSWISKRIGLTVFVGGKIGREPHLGFKLCEFLQEKEVYRIAERSLEFFKKEGKKDERFGAFINRIGIERLKEVVL